ncbi:MAG: hypothetical protein HEQ23_04005 [Tepidisphaera sp.]
MTDDAHPARETVTSSARARVFVECLARALTGGDQASARDFEVVGREMRRARLQRGFPQSPRYFKFRRLAILATVLWVPVFLVLLMFQIARMPWASVEWVFGTISTAMLSLLYAPVVVICWLLALVHHRSPRVDHRVIIRTACPACEYDLRGVAPMLPVSKVGGVWLGPERCSECGLYWPLIPKELGGQDAGDAPQPVGEGRT